MPAATVTIGPEKAEPTPDRRAARIERLKLALEKASGERKAALEKELKELGG